MIAANGGNMQTTKLNVSAIKKIMDSIGMTQADLARKLNTSNQLIYYYFTSSGSVYKTQRIAKALSTPGHPIDWRDLII
jgi:transcriptional regulator with XRE-family HTH domain